MICLYSIHITSHKIHNSLNIMACRCYTSINNQRFIFTVCNIIVYNVTYDTLAHSMLLCNKNVRHEQDFPGAFLLIQFL